MCLVRWRYTLFMERRKDTCNEDSWNKLTHVSAVERARSARNVRARNITLVCRKLSYVSSYLLYGWDIISCSPLCVHVCVNDSLLTVQFGLIHQKINYDGLIAVPTWLWISPTTFGWVSFYLLSQNVILVKFRLGNVFSFPFHFILHLNLTNFSCIHLYII